MLAPLLAKRARKEAAQPLSAAGVGLGLQGSFEFELATAVIGGLPFLFKKLDLEKLPAFAHFLRETIYHIIIAKIYKNNPILKLTYINTSQTIIPTTLIGHAGVRRALVRKPVIPPATANIGMKT